MSVNVSVSVCASAFDKDRTKFNKGRSFDYIKKLFEAQRDKHVTHVFTYEGNPIGAMNNTAWQRVRKKVGLKQVRVYNLKHTFGRRLRAARISFEIL